MKLRDLSGERFGRLLVMHLATGADARSYVRWSCKCDCGNTRLIARSSLLNGDTQSCGCLQLEKIKERRTTHGLSRTVEYVTWRNMHSRCNDPRNKSYKNYGGRGVGVCPEWDSFEQFLSDMGNRPEGKTLERKDNNLGYSKQNCTWATKVEQNSNTRQNVLVTAFGVTKTIAEWANETGLNRTTIAYRLKVGMPSELALTKDLKPGRRLINPSTT